MPILNVTNLTGRSSWLIGRPAAPPPGATAGVEDVAGVGVAV